MMKMIIPSAFARMALSYRVASTTHPVLKSLRKIGAAALLLMQLCTQSDSLAQQSSLSSSPVITYQGMIQEQGSPITANVTLTTILYSDPQGQNEVWRGQYTTSVRDGYFSLELGSGTYPLPSSDKLDSELWLGVLAGESGQLLPLTRLSASPFALNVADKSITKEKIDMDYVSSITVNGTRVTSRGGDLNLIAKDGISLKYDQASSALIIKAEEFTGKSSGKADSTNWVGNTGFGNTDGGSDKNAVGGGWRNTADDATFEFNTVSGGDTNRAIGGYSTIGGGTFNIASDWYSTVGGGSINEAIGQRSTIAGGQGNTASGEASSVGGGQGNTASGKESTVGGGQGNQATGEGSTVGGGQQLNQASGKVSTIGGGETNIASGDHSTVGGGQRNEATAEYASVLGGQTNHADAFAATAVGGHHNDADGILSFVGGGGRQDHGTTGNQATGDYSVIGGGSSNDASGKFSFIGGGGFDDPDHFSRTNGNVASTDYGIVVGGKNNESASLFGSIVGGLNNKITSLAHRSFIGAGGGNVIDGSAGSAVIGGGDNNKTFSYGSTIGGGANHTVHGGNYNTIGGGLGNQVGAENAPNHTVVAGGLRNTTLTGDVAAIGGGVDNTTKAFAANIPGGQHLNAKSYAQTVIGYYNTAQGSTTDAVDAHTASNRNDRVFIIGNGTDNGSRSNAFEVSNNGHSVVYDRNGTGAAVGGRGAMRGATYTDNVMYAWGAVPAGVANGLIAPTADFGVASVTRIAAGTYNIVLNIRDADDNAITLEWLSPIVTVQGDGCYIATVTNVNNNSNNFTVLIHQVGGVASPGTCSLVNMPFHFHVTGRPPQ